MSIIKNTEYIFLYYTVKLPYNEVAWGTKNIHNNIKEFVKQNLHMIDNEGRGPQK